jgi:hypothetical protein
VKRECASHVHEVVDSEVALNKRVVTSDNDPITFVAFVLVEHIDLAVYEPECAQSKAAAAAAASSDELVAAKSTTRYVRLRPSLPGTSPGSTLTSSGSALTGTSAYFDFFGYSHALLAQS